MDDGAFIKFFLEVVDFVAPGVLEIKVKGRLNYVDVILEDVGCFALFVNCASSSNIRLEIFSSYFTSEWSELRIEACTLRMGLDNGCVDRRLVAFLYEMMKFAPSEGRENAARLMEKDE